MVVDKPETPNNDADALSPLTVGTFCPNCGYDLRGSRSPVCTECGGDINFIRTMTPAIRWEQRRQRGWIRSYWWTVAATLLDRKLMARQMCVPVSYPAAQWFRWITLLQAIAAVALSAYLFDVRKVIDWEGQFGDYLPIVAVSLGVAAVLVLAAWTGLPSYFFHPRWCPVEVQNRAIALSYYTAGVLALSPWLILVYLLMTEDRGAVGAVTALTAAAIMLIWWLQLVLLARRLFRRRGRTLLVALCVPLLWCLTAALVTVGVVGIPLYVTIIIRHWPG
ncbi:MAG: hypothetical protein JXO22_11435 [Phycisphaerae bacterium]|nr:hypothetical protein [Phycisphaerae bacterium]